MLLSSIFLLIASITLRASLSYSFIKCRIGSLLNSCSLFLHLVINLNLSSNDNVSIKHFIFVTFPQASITCCPVFSHFLLVSLCSNLLWLMIISSPSKFGAVESFMDSSMISIIGASEDFGMITPHFYWLFLFLWLFGFRSLIFANTLSFYCATPTHLSLHAILYSWFLHSFLHLFLFLLDINNSHWWCIYKTMS